MVNDKMKQTYQDGLKFFLESSPDSQFEQFCQLSTAAACMEAITSGIRNLKEELPTIDFSNPGPLMAKIAKLALDWSTVYLKAGVDWGYCVKAEEAANDA